MAEHHVLREGVVKHAPSGADHSLAFASDVPGNADARREVLLVRVVEARQSGLTDLRESEGSSSRSRGDAGDIAQQIVLFADHAVVVVTQTEVDGQALRGAVAILHIESDAVFMR